MWSRDEVMRPIRTLVMIIGVFIIAKCVCQCVVISRHIQVPRCVWDKCDRIGA